MGIFICKKGSVIATLMLVITPFMIVGLIVGFAAGATSLWPEFRGPTGQGLATASGVPFRWDAENDNTWQTAIPGKGWSSPILLNDRVYLTTAIADGDIVTGPQSLRALCLNATSGELIWNVEVFTRDEDTEDTIHDKNSHASGLRQISGPLQ